MSAEIRDDTTRLKNEEGQASKATTKSAKKADKKPAALDGMATMLYFAKMHALAYSASVILAIIGVAGSITPYFAAAKMIIAILDGNRDLNTYIFWAIVAFIGFMVKIAFHSISTALSHKATFSVITIIRNAIVEKLQRTPLGYVLNTPSGKLKNILVEKVDSIEPTLAHAVPELTSNLLMPIAIIIYLFTIDWRMALVSLIVLPLGAAFYAGMMRDYETRFGVYVEANKHMNATAVEYVNGIEVIKAFGQSASSYKKFTNAVDGSVYSALNWMKSVQIYFDLSYAVTPATLVGVLPVGCIFVMNGSLEVSSFIIIIMLSLGIIQPIFRAVAFVDEIARISTIMSDIAAVLAEPEQQRPNKSAALTGHEIVLNQVSFSYENTEILHDVDLTIKEGFYTALVGPSGSGKSTLARLIAGYWDVDSGTLSVGGVALHDISFAELMNQIAFVSQDTYLFDGSVMENIRMGNPRATDDEVIAAARASGCHEFIMQLENGYETGVGSSGGRLSGGERQRIAIARAMLKDAPIVILDEATAYTDPENEAVIQHAVAQLVTDKTLIVIAHRLSTITDADCIVVMNEGSIEDRGTHDVLLERCELYRNMYLAHIEARDAT